MMWTHHDRMLRSPEGDGSGGGAPPVGQPPAAPQGAPVGQPQGQQPAAGEYVPRSMFEEAKGTRDAAKERARVAEAERDRLASELEQLKRAAPKPPEPSPPKPAPDGAADPELRARLDRLEAADKAKAIAERQRTLAERVAEQVPDARQHSLIPTIISGMHPNGLPDGEIDAVATSLLTSLRSQHPSLFDAPPGSPRTALQKGPTGQINWDEVRSEAEIPHGVRIPTEVYARLRTQNQGNTSLILGSREPSKS